MKLGKSRMALVGIGAAGLLTFSAGGAFASTNSPAPVETANGCQAGISFWSDTQAQAWVTAGNSECSYAFAVMHEPGDRQTVLKAATLPAGQPWTSASDYTHNSTTLLRICINDGPGTPTTCTAWAY